MLWYVLFLNRIGSNSTSSWPYWNESAVVDSFFWGGLISWLGRRRRWRILTRGIKGLAFFETSRGALKSDEWMARQLRKVYGAIKAIDAFVKEARESDESDFLIGDELSIADIAAGAMLGMMDMVETQFGLIRWKEDYPELLAWWERLEERESFRETRPVMFELTEKVV